MSCKAAKSHEVAVKPSSEGFANGVERTVTLEKKGLKCNLFFTLALIVHLL